jgi:ATP-dependent Lhr-like helicase
MQINVESPYPTTEDKIIAEKIFIGDSVVARLRRIHEIIMEHKSALTFTNTREAAEILSSRLRLLDKDFPHEIHHSSLSKEVRVKAEKDFKAEKLKTLICVSGDARILTENGAWKKINDFQNDQNIISINQKTLKGKESISSSIVGNGEKDVFELKSNLGFRIKTTDNHKFLTINKNSRIEWKELKYLKPEDPIAIFNSSVKGRMKEFMKILPDETYIKIREKKIDKIKIAIKSKNITYEQLAASISCKRNVIRCFIGDKKFAKLDVVKKVFRYLGINLRYEDIINIGTRNYNRYKFPKYIDSTFARLVGFLLSDGTITRKGRIRFFNKNVKLLEEFKGYLLDNFNIKAKYKMSPEGVTALEAEATWLGNTLAKIGVVRGRKARILSIPEVIFELPIRHRYNFLAGYFDGDGNYENKKGRLVSIIFNTYSKKAAEDIQLLLLGLGIVSSLRESHPEKRGYHVAVIGGYHLKRFIKNCKSCKIGYNDFITKGGYSNIDTIYNLGDYLKTVRSKAGISTYKMQKLYGINPIRYEYGERTISRKNLKKLLKIYSRYTDIGNEIMKLLDSDIFWDKICSINPAGKENVYDIIDNEYGNFISNGFVLHNCTSSLELGIDIGSIDIVLQYQSPRQVTKITQKVGRSGHGVGRVSKGIIIASEGDDIFESAVIARKALRGELEQIVIHENSLDVLTHQIMGMLIENYKMNPKEVYEIVKRAYPFRNLKEGEFLTLLNFLATLGLIYIDTEIKRKRRAFEYYFENLSVIPDHRNYKIIDTTTNMFVGNLDEEFIASHSDIGSTFIVRGRPWKILSIEKDKIYVEGVDDITSAIPAWEGELIPVPFEVSQEVGELRKEIKNMIGKDLKTNDMILKLKEKYPVSSQSAVKMIQLIKRQIEKHKLPAGDEIVCERFQDYVVLHSLFGNKVNETLSRFISTILSAEHGELIMSKCDPYRMIFKGCTIEEIKKILTDYNPEDVQIILEKSLSRSSLFKSRFIHVAKRFGAISRSATFNTINIDRMIDAYWNSPIHTETLQELFTEKMDLEKTKEIIGKIKNKEIMISEEEGLSPLAELGFRYELQDVVKPERPEKEIFNLFKNRLMNSKVRLLCINCGKYSINEYVKDVEEEPRCRKCQSRLIAVLRIYQTEIQKIASKWLKGGQLTEEEEEKLRHIKKSADLVIVYGKKAVIAMAGRGVGPETAKRILAKMYKNEESFYKEILKAEREFIKNKRFWQ